MTLHRRPGPLLRGDPGAAVAEYVGMVVVMALLVGAVGGVMNRGGVDLGNTSRRAICKVVQATGSAGDCPQVEARGRDSKLAVARPGKLPAALHATAAAEGAPTRGTGPDGENVILTRCGTAQTNPAEATAGSDGAVVTTVTSVNECVDADGGARECTTVETDSTMFGFTEVTCTAPVSDPVVAGAVIERGADPDTVVKDDCGDHATGMTPQARAAADEQFGPPPTGPALDTAFDTEMDTLATSILTLTGYDIRVDSDRANFQSAMRSVNDFVRTRPDAFGRADHAFEDIYKARPDEQGHRGLQTGCEIYTAYIVFYGIAGSIGAGYYLFDYNKDDPEKYAKAGLALTALFAGVVGGATWDVSRVRRGQVVAAQALVDSAAAVLARVRQQIEAGLLPYRPLPEAVHDLEVAHQGLADTVRENAIDTANALQTLRAANQGFTDNDEARGLQMQAFQRRLDRFGYDGQPIAQHDL